MLATATLPLSSSQIICTEITTSIFPLSLKSGTNSYFFESWSASLNADRITDPDFKMQFVFKNTGFIWSLACAACEAKMTEKIRSNVLIVTASLSSPRSRGRMGHNHTRNSAEPTLLWNHHTH